MRKIWVFLFLGVTLLPHSAGAKVCFLPSIFGGDEYCLSDEDAKEYEGCRGFEQITPCLPGQEQISCTKGNTTYYHCYCREDTYKYEDYPQYQCKEGYTEECGCAAKNVECKPEYKYKGDGFGYCKDWKNSLGIDACILPNGEVYYKDCMCDEDAFPTTCYETGLKRPVENKYICTQPDGTKYYAGCECDMNAAWSPNACAERTNGCTEGVTTVESIMPERGANGTTLQLVCTKCQDVLCDSDDLINIETRYCERTDEVTYDCEQLGYTYAPTGTCPAGTGNAGQVGVRCPFDRNFMNCSALQNCYPNEISCLLDNQGAKTCTLDETSENVCYRVTSCDSTIGYTFDGNGCKSTGCPMGYKAGLTQEDCLNGSELETINQKSGGETCAKCACTPGDTCYYTSQQHDMSTVMINGEGHAPIYAGYGSLVGLCCNGYYAACNNLCSGRDFDEDYDPNMQDWEVCEACGKRYYTIKTCQDGYELKSGQCQIRQCDEVNGYSAQFQSTSECVDNSGLYKGAVGWQIETQKENGNNVHSGSDTCGKCVCSEPEDPTDSDICHWSNNNKNKNGVLKDEDLCCNGYYQRCYSNAPSIATSDACNDENATEMDDYLACDFDKVCIIKKCRSGYELQGNVCVLSRCPEDYDTTKQSPSECGEGTGWNFEIKKDASGQNVMRGDDFCTKCTCVPASGCKWSVANAGNATLDGLCCDDTYTTCTSKCTGYALAELVTGTGAIVDEGVATKQECEACGVTLYTATACRNTNGYTLVNGKCQHVGCPDGWTSGLNSCAEGYTAIAHSINTDNSKVCGQCQETPCADGYATSAENCATEAAGAVYWKLDMSSPNGKSGPKTCYKCAPKTCTDMGGKTVCDPANENSATLAYYDGSKYKTDCNTCTEKTADEKCEYRHGSGWYGYEAGKKCGLVTNGGIGVMGVFAKSNDNKCFTCLSCTDAGAGYYPTALSCARGYTCALDQETGCYTVTSCASGFYKDDCATLTNGNVGWSWTEVVLGAPYNTVSCGTCAAKECTSGLSTSPECAPISETIAWSDTVFSGASKCGSCVCATGYAATLDNCGPTKSAGWKFDDSDTNACKKCIIKTCEDYGFEEDDGDRLGYIKEERKVTIGDNAAYSCYEYVAKTSCDRGVLNEEQCGVGSWKLSAWNGDKAGIQECYDCLAVRTVCPTGTASTEDLNTCGMNGAKGWGLTETINTYKNGNVPCYVCEPLECEENYSVSKSCDPSSERRVPSDTRYSGASTCYTCVCNTPNYQSAATSCGTKGSLGGWKFETSNTCNLCYEKDCTDHNYETETCPEGYSVDSSSSVYLGDRSATCHKCKIAPCADGYATIDNGCGNYRTPDMNVTKSKSGESICYQCICDNSKGYYASCPDGASCETSLSDGCYKTKGCANNLVASGTEGLSYFKTSNPKTFNLNGTNMTCYTIDGCDNAVSRSNAPTTLQNQMFESVSYTLGGKTCWAPLDCKEGYLRDRTCETEHGPAFEAVQVDTWISMTCRLCKEKSCDSQGFYERTGTSHICPSDRICVMVTTPLGSVCENSQECSSSGNYVSSAAKNTELYVYGVNNPLGKATQDTLDCALLTSCNNSKGSFATLDDLANYLGVIRELVASEIHKQAVTTCYTGEIFCNNTIGYWDTSDECLAKYTGHLCKVHTASGCYIMSGCNNATGHFDTNPQCVGAYTGRLCALDNTSQCYKKAGCDNSTGHFDTNQLCVNAYTGRLCALDNASQCYKRAGCDNSDGYYDTEPQCLAANSGYLCAMETASGCYKKTTCDSTHCGSNCGTTTVQCPSNTYPYPKKDHATMSGECQPISAGGTFTCSYDAKMYKSFICNTGWKKNANQNGCEAKTCGDYSDTPDTSCDSGCYICGSESVPTGDTNTTCWHKTAKVCTDYTGWIAAGARSTTYFTYKEENKCTGTTNTKCYKLDGCNSTNGWLPASDVDGDKFAYSTQTSGSLTCRKATACNESKGWYAYDKISQYVPHFAMSTETRSGVTCYKVTGCLSTGGVTATKPGGCKTYKTATYGTLPCYYDISSTGASDCTTTNPGDCKKWSTSTDTNGNTVYYNISNVGTNSTTTKPTGCKTWNYENGTNGNTCYWNVSAVFGNDCTTTAPTCQTWSSKQNTDGTLYYYGISAKFGNDCTTSKPGSCKTYSSKANTANVTYYYNISTTGAADCTTGKPSGCKTWNTGTDTNGNTVYYNVSNAYGSDCTTTQPGACKTYSTMKNSDNTTYYYGISTTGASDCTTTKPTCKTWTKGTDTNGNTVYYNISAVFGTSCVTAGDRSNCYKYSSKNDTAGTTWYYNPQIMATGASTTKPTGCQTWSSGNPSANGGNSTTCYWGASGAFANDCTTSKPGACKTYSTKNNTDGTTYYYSISTTGASDCTTGKPSGCKTWNTGTDTNGNTVYYNVSNAYGSDCTTTQPGACKTYSTMKNSDNTTYYYGISTTGASDCTTTKPTCKTWTKGTDTNGNTVYYNISAVFGTSCVTAGDRSNCYKYSSKNDTAGTTWYYNPQIMATGASTTKPTGCQTWSSGNPSANGGNSTTCYWGASGAFANDCTTSKPGACKTYSTKNNTDGTTYYYSISTTGAADCTTTKPSCKTWTKGTDTNGNTVYYNISGAFGSSCVKAGDRASCYNYSSKNDTDGTTWYYNPSIIATGATTSKPSVTASNCHSFSTGSGTNGVTCYYNDSNVTSSKPATTTTTSNGDSTSCTLSQSCSASCSESQSCSASCSESQSCSASCSESQSCSASCSESQSCSASCSESQNCSSSYSESQSCSAGCSDSTSSSVVTNTDTQSCGCGGSQSRSYTQTCTQYRSGTKYGTQSRTCTVSGTQSRSGTKWGTQSRTGTKWGTQSRSGTKYGTQSRSGTKYGTQSRSGTKYGTQSRSGTKYGTQYRSGTKYRDINYTRSVTCNANGGGWDVGSWTVSSYGSWGSCSSSASWGSCTDFGACQWGSWGSCGSYGACQWGSWGACGSYGACQWGSWGACGNYGSCSWNSWGSCGSYGSCSWNSWGSCGNYGSCSWNGWSGCSNSSTSCGGWSSCGSYGSCSWGGWGGCNYSGGSWSGWTPCSNAGCSALRQCINGSCVLCDPYTPYDSANCITTFDFTTNCGVSSYKSSCSGSKVCRNGVCLGGGFIIDEPDENRCVQCERSGWACLGPDEFACFRGAFDTERKCDIQCLKGIAVIK